MALFLSLCLFSSILSLASSASVYPGYPLRPIKLKLPPDGCTAIIVDPLASTDGAMTTHTNDCNDCDFRLSLVKARDYDDDAMRPILPSRFAYPRYIGPDRGSTLVDSPAVDRSIYNWEATKPIGQIKQVKHTYAYIEGAYGIINEHQVAMGESTCSGRIVAAPIYAGGRALFDVSELMRIALERATTARQAIQIMGDLATQYGYYGAEWEGYYALGEAGEGITVTDPREAWVFHILPDVSGASAIWVAQRVPSGHISVIANAFSIQEVNFDDKDNFMYSDNIISHAVENNFWKPNWGVPFNFAAVYGEIVSGEVYCSRRVWRIFALAAPSVKLSPNATMAELPFSVQVEGKLNRTDLMRMQRDHYEGTEFDMTVGFSAGPFGNPNRYDRAMVPGLSVGVLMQGSFERAISLYRTSYSFVTLSRSWVPDELAVVWFAPSIPHASFYQPFYPFSEELPKAYTIASLYALDHGSAWWSVTAVGNYMERMYSYMLVDVVAAQQAMESGSAVAAAGVESRVSSLLSSSPSEARAVLTEFQNSGAQAASVSWWALFDHLITRFHDGQRLDDFHSSTFHATGIFYPAAWLKAVGDYWKEPINWNITHWSYTMPQPNRPTPPPESSSSSSANVNVESSLAQNSISTASMSATMIISLCAILMAAAFIIGYYAGRKANANHGYLPIQDRD